MPNIAIQISKVGPVRIRIFTWNVPGLHKEQALTPFSLLDPGLQGLHLCTDLPGDGVFKLKRLFCRTSFVYSRLKHEHCRWKQVKWLFLLCQGQ